MKKRINVLVVIIFTIVHHCYSQEPYSWEGKSFEKQIAWACVKNAQGGGIWEDYTVISFREKEAIFFSYRKKIEGDPNSISYQMLNNRKSYTWYIKDTKIVIKDCKDCDHFTVLNDSTLSDTHAKLWKKNTNVSF